MKFSFVKRIDTTKDSIFYSFIRYRDSIIGFGRRHYGQRVTKQIVVDENFNVIEDTDTLFRGEDPRCFEFNGNLYVLDNYFNDMHLVDYTNKTYIRLNISGKNPSFFSHSDTLYFIHYIKPFALYTFDVHTGAINRVEVDDDKKEYNYEYRGGTPGYRLNDTDYYGFGHRTYTHGTVVKHDIFKWVVHFGKDSPPRISHYDIEQPANSQNICDPTSVIEINNKQYLVTAESEKIWFCDQDYITNLYEIQT